MTPFLSTTIELYWEGLERGAKEEIEEGPEWLSQRWV